MESHESRYKEFMNYLRPFGDERLQFLLYGMREKSAGPFRVPDLSGWPHGTELKSFAFTDEHWPVVIELFEFWSSGFPEHCEQLLLASLSALTGQGAILSWYMFEGTFNDIAHVFTPWTIERTYGVARPGQAPRLAITKAARRQKSWRALAEQVADALYHAYPELQTVSSNGNAPNSLDEACT